MAKVLICDDDSLVRRGVLRALTRAGHLCQSANDGEAALAALERSRGEIDVLLTDYHMPKMDGLHLLHAANCVDPQLVSVLMSGVADFNEACKVVNEGRAYRLLAKPFDFALLCRVVSEAASLRESRRQRRHREAKLAEQLDQLVRSNDDLAGSVEDRTTSGLLGLVAALELRDTETQWHSRRVSLYARKVAEALQLTGTALLDCERGALLHDVGKIGVRDSILLKPAALDADEWEEMRRHPGHGYQILRPMGFLAGAAEIVYSHHERWDGGGYPRGIRAEEICIGARIFSVVDTYDAIRSDRPYRKGRSHEVAVEEIQRCSGTQFDPRIAGVFCSFPGSDWDSIAAQVEDVRRVLERPIPAMREVMP